MRTKSLDAYCGVIVPMINPFDSSGCIDISAAERLMDYLSDNGTIPFILGTTGEAASIPLNGREKLVRVMVEKRKEGVPVTCGVIGLNVQETIVQANRYFEFGADAVVITPPCSYQLSDKQMLKYYETFSDNLNGNIILYNIPKTVHQSIHLEIADSLSRRSNIIGIKDSEVNPDRLRESLSLWKNRDDFFHFTGTNFLMLEGLLNGSKGIVPSTANFIPDVYSELYTLCLENNREKAEEVFQITVEWGKLYQDGKTLGESLACLKVIMSELGLCQPFVLPPLTEPDQEEISRISSKVRTELAEKVQNS